MSGRRRAAGAALAGWLLVLALALLMAALAWWRLGGAAPAGAAERVVIATNTDYVGSCPVLAAREQGYFANEGIDAVLQPHSSGKSAMEAVLQGRAQLGTVADIPVMFAGLYGRPVAVIASIFKAEKDHGIVARRDRGVAAPASLKGKRIGVTLSTSSHFTLDAFLNRQRLLPREVSMHNYPPEKLAAALASGEIDAASAWEPFLAEMLAALGQNGVAFYGEDVYESIYNVVAMRAYIGAQPDTIKRVLRALRGGAQFCADKPDAARTMLAAGSKNDNATWQASWPLYRFGVVLDQGLILALEDEARWAIKNQLSPRNDIPNYLDYVYLDGLEAVQSSAVTIIH